MASVVFYFQVHQPWRLRRYSVFDTEAFYFESAGNKEILRKVAEKCYRPATRQILEMVRAGAGNVRVSYSITGTVLEQLEAWAPDVVDLFRALVDTGCCEMLSESYHHSLSFLGSREEFRAQVELHTEKMRDLFGQTPRVFRNTELVYSNEIGRFVAEMTGPDGSPRFDGMLCEGVDRILGYRSPNYVYRPPAAAAPQREGRPFGLLLKNYRLSDDIAFRFSNRDWADWPLTTDKFARWVNQINGDGYLCNLFLDYETFGEHQWSETGIFEFLRDLPRAIFDIAPGENHFITPSEALAQFDPVGEYDVPHVISWADTERDLSAWLGNSMQAGALHEIYKLERPIKDALGDAQRQSDEARARELRFILADWRKLTTSDHLYYMCTKYFADGDVHKYFNPYDSPYDSYINYMNVMDNLRDRLARAREPRTAPVVTTTAAARAGAMR